MERLHAYDDVPTPASETLAEAIPDAEPPVTRQPPRRASRPAPRKAKAKPPTKAKAKKARAKAKPKARAKRPARKKR